MEEHLKFAIKVARRLWKDPEAESIAGIACLLAVRSWREDAGRTLDGWIASRVRLHIWCEWRRRARRKEELAGCVWEAECVDDPPDESPLSRQEWRLLTQRYIDRIPMDVIARREMCSMRRLRAAMAEAVESARALLTK